MKNNNILILDDEQDILDALQRVFDDYEVTTTTSADEALSKLSNQAFAVIISDHKMPEISGTEFLNQAKHIAPNSVRILLTGYSEGSIAIDAINKGEIFRYLTKPWDDEDILHIMDEAVHLYDSQCENTKLKDKVFALEESYDNLTKTFVRTTEMYNAHYSPKSDASFDEIDIFEELTRKEIEIVRVISKGLSNIEIANELGNTESTIKNHLAKIYKKLNINNRGELIALIHESVKQ